MAIKASEAFQLVKKSAKDFSEDECPRMAASLAYYTVFALPPMLILIMMLVGAFVSRETVQDALSGQMGSMLGADGAKTVGTMVNQSKQPEGGSARKEAGRCVDHVNQPAAVKKSRGRTGKKYEGQGVG